MRPNWFVLLLFAALLAAYVIVETQLADRMTYLQAQSAHGESVLDDEKFVELANLKSGILIGFAFALVSTLSYYFRKLVKRS